DGSLRRVLSRLEKEGTPHEVSCVLGGGFGAVTLPETAVPVLEALIREVRGVPLYSMRPPVHCSALAGLRERALKLISAAGPADPRIPLVSDLDGGLVDRKSTRLNSSHVKISYAVFCLKKKKTE